MALGAGTRLGPYEIQSLIGAGGMGEVYKAQDTRLDRTVAIKVLPTEISGDPARRARFEREAKTIATLAHPHVCTLFDVGDHSGSLFLVMEHLQGQTLADRISKGALPIEQVLEYGAQIAEALSVAHRNGIIHRDLKPANVMLTKSGVKLLDFGLAKLKRDAVQATAAAAATAVATRTEPLTGEGTILGTLQYMAPEQLEGKEADARTDIWALGLVLYEMVTGRQAFEGQSSASLIAAILDRQPPVASALQPLAPRSLDHLLKRCLAKEPEQRWQTATDLREELRWIAESSRERMETLHQPWRRNGRLVALGAISAVLIGGATVLTWTVIHPSVPPSRSVQRWAVPLTSGQFLGRGGPGRLLTISPNGKHFVYGVGTGPAARLYQRHTDRLDAIPIPGTDGGSHPFFSPDGQWLGFIADGRLKKVPLTGGPAVALCDVGAAARGATWVGDDTVVFADPTGNLMAVASSGGTPRIVAEPDRSKGEQWFRWPSALPGGHEVLATVGKLAIGPSPRAGQVVVVSLDTGKRRIVVEGGWSAMYARSGHLLFVRDSSLFAAPFDLTRLELRSQPTPVLDGILTFGAGAANYDLSEEGTLVYVPGQLGVTLAWVDAQGRVDPIRQGAWSGTPQLSPDGRRVAVEMAGDDGSVDIWIYDLARNGLTRFTTGGINQIPRWSPDGRWLAFTSNRDGSPALYRKPADFSGPEERLVAKPGKQSAEAFSPDGEFLFYSEVDRGGRSDLWKLRFAPGATPSPVIATRFSESQAAVSPDGNWLAYVSDESGRDEVYVSSLAGRGERLQVSTEGGVRPAWSRTGGALFFLSSTRITYGNQAMMTVNVMPGATLRLGTPRRLFEGAYGVGIVEYEHAGFGVVGTGERFLMLVPSTDPTRMLGQFVAVTNWFEELKAKVPVK